MGDGSGWRVSATPCTTGQAKLRAGTITVEFGQGGGMNYYACLNSQVTLLIIVLRQANDV